jgi:hypothetical protein
VNWGREGGYDAKERGEVRYGGGEREAGKNRKEGA